MDSNSLFWVLGIIKTGVAFTDSKRRANNGNKYPLVSFSGDKVGKNFRVRILRWLLKNYLKKKPQEKNKNEQEIYKGGYTNPKGNEPNRLSLKCSGEGCSMQNASQ